MSTYLDELPQHGHNGDAMALIPISVLLETACATVDALRAENARLKGLVEKAQDMNAENYRAANGYMELLDREKVVSELLRIDLTALRPAHTRPKSTP